MNRLVVLSAVAALLLGCGDGDGGAPSDAAAADSQDASPPADARADSTPQERLAAVRVATLFEHLTDSIDTPELARDVDGNVALLAAMETDLVLRGFFVWAMPVPDTCAELAAYPELQAACEQAGYSYAHLGTAISKLRAARPDAMFCGAVPAQIINRQLVWNPETQTPVLYPATWNRLALDPGKWGLSMTKEELQCRFGKSSGWVAADLECASYDPAQAAAYFPDLTNDEYRAYLLGLMHRQVDAGADAMWVDMFMMQANMLAAAAGSEIAPDYTHAAVVETYRAAGSLITAMHEYAASKAKAVLMGSWGTFPAVPGEAAPPFDFCTVTPSGAEVSSMTLDANLLAQKIGPIRAAYPDLPIFAFIDWASTTTTPLGRFSQSLTNEQQRSFLRLADAFYASADVVLSYPIHGGTMGTDSTKCAFGDSHVYDSQSSDCETYATSLELALAKQ
jgi:hypothetical protein